MWKRELKWSRVLKIKVEINNKQGDACSKVYGKEIESFKSCLWAWKQKHHIMRHRKARVRALLRKLSF
jgi:hypothetical protein